MSVLWFGSSMHVQGSWHQAESREAPPPACKQFIGVWNPGLSTNLSVDGAISSADLPRESHVGLGTRHGLQQFCIWHHFWAVQHWPGMLARYFQDSSSSCAVTIIHSFMKPFSWGPECAFIKTLSKIYANNWVTDFSINSGLNIGENKTVFSLLLDGMKYFVPTRTVFLAFGALHLKKVKS